jgi:protocatechuate 3,4-dioxygenase beta subunit
VADGHGSAAGAAFLRGYQLTNANGEVRFLTVYPGWYPGRAVHIHFKLRGSGREFTSQLYFDEAVTDAAHADPAYRRTGRRLRNEADGLFRDGGRQLIMAPARSGEGYAAAFQIGLASA